MKVGRLSHKTKMLRKKGQKAKDAKCPAHAGRSGEAACTVEMHRVGRVPGKKT